MAKRLLSLVTALVAFCCLTNAQQLQKSEIVRPLKYKSVVKTTPSTRASAENVAFTYAQGTKVSPVGSGASSYDCAIFVPGSLAGNKIDVIGFYIVDKSVVSNAKCWISKTLPTNVSTGCDFIQNVTVTDDVLTTGYPNYVENVNYTIPEGGCYVGYSFNVTNVSANYGKYPIAFDGENDLEGGAYCNMQGSGWQDMNGLGFGCLLTTVLMSGDKFSGNAATLTDTDFSSVVVKNTSANVLLSVRNLGVNDMKSLSYTVKDVATGSVSDEKTVTLNEGIRFYGFGKVAFSLDGGNEPGMYEKEFTITKVNGQTNENNDAVTVKGIASVVSRNVTKKIVVEEFTGTGCPNCPRGYAGMEALSEKYPNEFIGIAAHTAVNYPDPMETNAYDDVLRLFQSGISVPSVFLNRINNMEFFDPYFGSSQGSTILGIFDDFELMRGAAEAEVVARPQWNENQTAINVKADVTFLYNRDDAPYALAYVLLIDGLQGSEDSWWQYNGNSYMYGNSQLNEPYLDSWLMRGERDNIYVQGYGNLDAVYVKDMVYDHVALASQNLVPTAPSLKAPIKMDETQTATATFDVSNGIKGYYLGNELIQDKSKLKVVAMLINTETGEIVNADESEIAAYDPTGIENVTATGEEAVEVARYALDGTQLSAPAKGINIIKMSDGTTKKVIVK